jgi:hypothetical protein
MCIISIKQTKKSRESFYLNNYNYYSLSINVCQDDPIVYVLAVPFIQLIQKL